MKTKKVFIKNIMDSPPTNSGLKRKDVLLHNKSEELLPVYSASKDEKFVFGWLTRNSKWRKYKNVLTWNKDGSSSGYVFYRKEEFIPYEKIKILKIKPKFENTFDYKFLCFIIQERLLASGFDFNFKCSMDRVMNITIDIPINEKNEFDLKMQQTLAKGYEKIYTLKKELQKTYEDIKKIKVNIEDKYETIEIPLSDLFDIEKGYSKYTKSYIRNHKGEYPVYSSQTTNDGIIGHIDTFDYDIECLTWTTDGIYAGTVFYRKEKFSMTTHCGVLIPKDEYKVCLNLRYISFQLNNNLKRYALSEGNKRVTVDTIKGVLIKIPIDEKGDFYLQKQSEIAQSYEKIEYIRKNVVEEFKEMACLNIKHLI